MRCAAIAFDNPAAFTGTIAVNVGAKEDTAAASHKPLDNNGSAVTLTAGRYQRHEVNGFESISVQTDGTEAAERSIDVYAILTTDS